jgi:peptide/nickel transport system substrate-binding protein
LSLFGAGIVSPEAVRMYGEGWAVNPVGTGPYRLERWDRDVRIVLARFEDYWGAKPGIERVIVVPVQSPQTAIQRLKQGEVHVVDHPTLADIVPLESDAATKVDFETSMNVCYLGFNMMKPPYNDRNFRLAVSLALDRSSLNNLAYYDLAEPAANIVPPAIWKDIAPTQPYEYNIEMAKALLAKVKLDSNEVELIHMTFARPYVPEPQRVAEWVKDQLRKIGLEVKLTGYDKQAYTVKTKEPDHPMFLMGWNMDYPDPDNFFYPLLHGDNAGDLNGSFFNDPEFNDAVSKAQSELNVAARAKLYAKAYERYRDEQPTIPLVHVRQLIALSKRVVYDMHPAEYRLYTADFVK